ncbi:centrobin isoform X2 [Scleropages formosus]|nr:centrobin isoform X2 [Scleropages formosus]
MCDACAAAMSSLKSEEPLSDVEPLPPSAAPSPPASFLSPPPRSPRPPPHSPPSLARSWPPSPPLTALSSSSRVTARLYASLRSTQGLGLADPSEHAEDPRQVRFSVSAPVSLRTDAHVGWPDTSPPTFLEGRPEEPAGGACRAGRSDLELGELAEQMSVKLKASLESTAGPLSAQSGHQHIEDMENVRNHLQTLLRTDHEPIEGGRGATYLAGIPLLAGQRKDSESFESDTTSRLLSAPLLDDVSPPLSDSGLDELFPLYSRLRPHGVQSSSSDVHVLQDRLNRERTRRKQCETQIQVLQNKVLLFQQQVALAVSADRRKDIMIEQLDKTLAKVVEGWRKHEEEKSEGMKRLQDEKEAADRAQAQQQEMLAHFEQSLSQAAETLDREKKHREELSSVNQQLQQQICELRRELEEQGRRFERSRAELQEAHKEAQEAHGSLAQHREAWSRRERELEERLAALHSDVDEERAHRQRTAQQLQEAQREAHSALGQLQQRQGELEEARRERDAARMDRALDQARFEAQRSQLEVELKLSVEQQVTERLAALQKDNAETTASLREQHRKQLLELSARHDAELSAQLAHFRAELQEREERQRELTQEYEKRLTGTQEQLLHLQNSTRKLEEQRTQLITQLQGLLRSHWAEALHLLATQCQAEDVPPAIPKCHTSSVARAGERSSWWAEPSPPSEELQEETAIDISPMNSCPSQVPDVPQAVILHMSRKKTSQLDLSSTFAPLEPQLDDTGVTALGSCDVRSLLESPPWGATHRDDRTACTGEGRPSSPQEVTRICCRANSPEGDVFQGYGGPSSKTERARDREVPRGTSAEVGGGSSGERWTPRGQEASRGEGLLSHLPPTGSLQRHVYDTAASTAQGARQAELQHYISMLLDRAPGDPLEPPVKGSAHPISVCSGSTVSRSGDSAQIGDSTQKALREFWEGERAPPAAGAVARPVISAVSKAKLQPPPPTKMAPCRPEPSCTLQAQSGAALPSAQLSQVSRLLTQLRSRPGDPTASLEELVTHLLCSQVDSSLVSPPGDGERNLRPAERKEGVVPSAAQRRLQPHCQRAPEAGRTLTQGLRGRRAGPQAQRGPSSRGTVWR